MTWRIARHPSEWIILDFQFSSMETFGNYEHYPSLQKAFDRAIWLTFLYRKRNEQFVVVDGPEDDFVVMTRADALENELHILNTTETRSAYLPFSYDHLESIRTDESPLPHWEEIWGYLSTIQGEVLRFILSQSIPLEKFIRYELAIRGYDQNNDWVGFEKSREIWCK
ncbi:MAG: hypothetical protein GC181_10640 [Bacteroidetes bacterium]|nr:hypothetical protein [Bacteroidota bacterium]